MRFTAERDALLKACQLAGAPIKRSHIPIYDHLLIRASDTHLTIQGASMEVTSAARCAASAPEAGASSAIAADLLKWLQACPVGCLIEAEGDGKQLSLSGGRLKATFPAFPQGDFPVMPKSEASEVVGGLEAIIECLPFVTHTEARPNLNGIHFDETGAMAAAVINGNAASTIYYDGPSANNATIPLESCQVIAKAGKAGGRLFVGETRWRFEAEGLHITGPLLGLDFPPARRLIGESLASCLVDADSLLSAIDAVTISGGSRVRFDCGEALTLSGDGFLSGVQTATAAMPCDTITPFRQCFSAEVIRKALSPFSGRVVTFGLHPKFGHWQLTAEGAPLVLAMGMSDVANELPVAA